MTTTTTRQHRAQLATPASDQRLAAYAALVKAATYVLGFAAMAAYLAPRGFVDAAVNPAESLAFLLENQSAMYVWYLLLYVVGGLALVVVVVGLDERMGASSPLVRRSTSAVGFVWAGLLLASGLVALVGQNAVITVAADDLSLATSTWSSVSVVQDALGGGIEAVGAVWVLAVSVAGLRGRTIGRGLSALGIAIGVAGVATLVPALAESTTSLFGIGFIVWFVWMGVVMLRPRP